MSEADAKPAATEEKTAEEIKGTKRAAEEVRMARFPRVKMPARFIWHERFFSELFSRVVEAV